MRSPGQSVIIKSLWYSACIWFLLGCISCGGGGSGANTSPSTGSTSSGTGSTGTGSGSGTGSSSFTSPTTRTDWVFVGAKIDAGADNDAPFQYVVFDKAHSQVFLSIPNLNQIAVFDSGTHVRKATLSVPTPFGMDLSADGKTIYVGSGTNFLFAIDTASLKLSQKFNTTSMVGGGFSPVSVAALADGRLVLFPGAGVDGSSAFVVWSPTTGASQVYAAPANVYAWGGFVRSGDHHTVMIAGTTTGSPVSIFNSDTNQFSSIPLPAGIVERLAANPAKDQFAFSDLNGNIQIVDSKLTSLGSIRIEPPNQIGGQRLNGMVFSADGTKLYLFVDSTIQGYDTTKFQQNGVMAQPYSLGIFAEPLPLDADDTGMVFGVNEDAMDFIDTSALTTTGLTTVGYGFGYSLGYLTPSWGPLSGGTSVTTGISIGAQFSEPASLTAYLGNRSVNQLNYAKGQVSFNTPPPAQPGPANLILQLSDGTPLFAPAAFSYGPSAVELVTTSTTADGGATAFLAGYGMGSSTNLPQVTIGGLNGTIKQLQTGLPGADSPFPTPIQALTFTLPPGIPGNADLIFTNSAGSFAVSKAVHYYPASMLHSSSSAMEAGVYDAVHHLIYFSAQKEIDVLSTSTGNWQPSIVVPNSGTATLVALSLSPDSNSLAVVDQGNNVILTLQPSNPASIRSFPNPDKSGLGLMPAGLAITNDGQVYFLLSFPWTGFGTRCQTDLFWMLNSSTGAFTDLSTTLSWCSNKQNRVLLTPDGSSVFIDADGQLKLLNTSDNSIIEAAEYNWATSDMAISSDGTRLLQQGGIIDANGNVIGAPVVSDIEASDNQDLRYGQKLDVHGSLLLQPNSGSLDLYDLGHLNLSTRIGLATSPADVFDSMVWDQDDRRAYLIVQGGVLEVDLPELPLVVASTAPASGPVSGGNYVELYGTAFQSGMTVSVNGTNATVVVQDQASAQIVMPPNTAGAVSITVTTPDGRTQHLDAGYVYQNSAPGVLSMQRRAIHSLRFPSYATQLRSRALRWWDRPGGKTGRSPSIPELKPISCPTVCASSVQ